ncbi:unnamed protein product [Prunus armeniaca]|uniref:Uncharacterized protein n=1 Tax=Prunus armeniaca TaxID=36596 RepID=A0A6J5VD73_PRUAR|nr:unnamed protein product [Prunus armeniaca]
MIPGRPSFSTGSYESVGVVTPKRRAENEHKTLKTRLRKADGNNNDVVTLTKYEISLKVHKRANGRQ